MSIWVTNTSGGGDEQTDEGHGDTDGDGST